MRRGSGTFPLGVDIGRRRIRVALVERGQGGMPKLLAVATREHTGEPHAALAAALDELQTRERRCVVALAPPDAVLCSTDFPPMPAWERVRAARFEAARFIDYPIAEAAVSLVRTNRPLRWAIGIVKRAALAAALATATRARLQPLAVDDVALALRRAHPTFDGAIDVGAASTRVVLFGEGIPHVAYIPIGGERLTDAIAQSLGIEAAQAEERKRTIGFGGAGEALREQLLAAINAALGDARAAGFRGAQRIVLCGNGSRVPGLDEALERATGYTIAAATLSPDVSDILPPDVLRSGAADWSVAYGLGLWSISA